VDQFSSSATDVGSHESHLTSHLLQHPLGHREADQLIQLQHPTVPTYGCAGVQVSESLHTGVQVSE